MLRTSDLGHQDVWKIANIFVAGCSVLCTSHVSTSLNLHNRVSGAIIPPFYGWRNWSG